MTDDIPAWFKQTPCSNPINEYQDTRVNQNWAQNTLWSIETQAEEFVSRGYDISELVEVLDRIDKLVGRA